MRLHIFNPEHDIALAANLKRFTAPHAGRQMRADLGFLPALWADDGDFVLVDDVAAALESVCHVRKYAHDVAFVSLADLKGLTPFVDDLIVDPWGWDITLKDQLLRANGALAGCMPSDEVLSTVRQMSSRRFAASELLPVLVNSHNGLVGESCYCETMESVSEAVERYGCQAVLKSPWSSSGRGVRYVRTPDNYARLSGWAANIVRQQGGIMVEPLYAKVCDFGMEFCVNKDGVVSYRGLSLFATSGGAYTGGLCATEKDKREMLSRCVDMQLLDKVCDDIRSILAPQLKGAYAGAFGIDMMAVARKEGEGFLLNPCVELNLRRTMGHVALALTPSPFEARRIMNVYYADKYRLRIKTTIDNLLNTGLCYM